MNDGIHAVRDFMVVTDHVERMSPLYRGLPLDDVILDIGLPDFEKILERADASDADFEAIYGEYNSYGYSPALNQWYAWYDNTR